LSGSVVCFVGIVGEYKSRELLQLNGTCRFVSLLFLRALLHRLEKKLHSYPSICINKFMYLTLSMHTAVATKSTTKLQPPSFGAKQTGVNDDHQLIKTVKTSNVLTYLS